MKKTVTQFYQSGMINPLILLAAVGVILFIILTQATPFKDRLNAVLYPKQASEAKDLP